MKQGLWSLQVEVSGQSKYVVFLLVSLAFAIIHAELWFHA